MQSVLSAVGRGAVRSCFERRSSLAAARHAGQASLVRTTQIQKARLRGTFWAGLDLVPNAVIGLILLLGALAVSQDELTLGGLVAFIALALQLVWPIEAMGYILSSGQEAATAAQRIYEIFDTEPAIKAPIPRQRGAPPSVKGMGRRVGSEGARDERPERGGKTAVKGDGEAGGAPEAQRQQG